MWSKRTAFDRRPNGLSLDLDLVRASGTSILDLSGSNPTEVGFPYDADVILGALADARSLRYRPEAFGLLEARQAIAAELVDAPPPERIVLTASTSESYGLVFKLLCDPGDEVAIPRPSYPLFEHLATLEGVRLVSYPLAYDGSWHIDLDALRACITPRTRAVIVVSPNNPTGSFLKKDEHAALGALGLPIVSDEVFADYAFGPDPRRARSARERSEVLTFSMGGLSKSCGLPQMKLAWTAITGPEPHVLESVQRLEIVADAYLSASTPIQLALPRLLQAGAVTRRAIMERIATNRSTLARALQGTPLTLLHVEGGWTACVRLPNTRTEDEWVRALLAEARVLVQPGAFYDFADEPFAVLGLLTEPRSFDVGVAAMVGFVTRS